MNAATYSNLNRLATRMGVKLPKNPDIAKYDRSAGEASMDVGTMQSAFDRIQLMDNTTTDGWKPDLNDAKGLVHHKFSEKDHNHYELKDDSVVLEQTRYGETTRVEQIQRDGDNWTMYSLINDQEGLRANITSGQAGDQPTSEYEKWNFA